MVSVKLSVIFRNYTKVDEIQETCRGMTIACEERELAAFSGLVTVSISDFLLDAGWTSEFEVFPQAATFP